MNIQFLLIVGAAVWFFVMNRNSDKKDEVEKVEPKPSEPTNKEHSLECLFKKWNDFRECAENLQLDDVVNDLDELFPKLNSKPNNKNNNPLGL